MSEPLNPGPHAPQPPEPTTADRELAQRREFLKATGVGASLALTSTAWPMLTTGAATAADAPAVAANIDPNMLGVYGPWAASIVGDQPPGSPSVKIAFKISMHGEQRLGSASRII